MKLHAKWTDIVREQARFQLAATTRLGLVVLATWVLTQGKREDRGRRSVTFAGPELEEQGFCYVAKTNETPGVSDITNESIITEFIPMRIADFCTQGLARFVQYSTSSV